MFCMRVCQFRFGLIWVEQCGARQKGSQMTTERAWLRRLRFPGVRKTSKPFSTPTLFHIPFHTPNLGATGHKNILGVCCSCVTRDVAEMEPKTNGVKKTHKHPSAYYRHKCYLYHWQVDLHHVVLNSAVVSQDLASETKEKKTKNDKRNKKKAPRVRPKEGRGECCQPSDVGGPTVVVGHEA